MHRYCRYGTSGSSYTSQRCSSSQTLGRRAGIVATSPMTTGIWVDNQTGLALAEAIKDNPWLPVV